MTLLVFSLDMWSLHRVLSTSTPIGYRIRWSALIVLAPILGALLWLRVDNGRTRKTREA